MKGWHCERGLGFALWHCAPGTAEAYFTVAFEAPEAGVPALYRRAYAALAERLEQHGLSVVQERVFGSLAFRASVLEGRDQAIPTGSAWAEHPFTFVQGRPLWGEGVAGIQLHAIRASGPQDQVSTIQVEGQTVGRAWKCQGATYYWLQRVLGQGGGSSPATRKDQSEAMFLRAEALLRGVGLDYTHVARTWIYLSNILAWYDDFNEVRNRLYGRWGLMPDPEGPADQQLRLPSSTGIRGDNSLGAACIMDFLAIKPTSAGAPHRSAIDQPQPEGRLQVQQGLLPRDPHPRRRDRASAYLRHRRHRRTRREPLSRRCSPADRTYPGGCAHAHRPVWAPR